MLRILLLATILTATRLFGPVAPTAAAGTAADERPAGKEVLAAALEPGPDTNHLPLAFARRALGEVDVVVHPTDLGEAVVLVEGLDGTRPSLMLHAPSLFPDQDATRELELLELTVDLAGEVFRGLLEVYLETYAAETPYAAVVERRAATLMAEVPEEHRVDAYRDALVDFGGHLLAVANEMERLARRHRARGSDLCVHLDRRWTLFGLWDRIFGELGYPGGYLVRGAGFGAGRWVEAPSLEVQDKRLLVEHVFDGFWRGERKTDLGARYCDSSSEGEPPPGAEPSAEDSPSPSSSASNASTR